MKHEIKYGDSTIRYTVVRSNRRKTSEIQVDGSGVKIIIPFYKTDAEIQGMVYNKRQWIFRKQLEFRPGEKALTTQAKSTSYVEKRVAKLALEIGVKPSGIMIKPLKGRWGSATESGVINLNAGLLRAPKGAIDYIIIHELCHLKIKGHNKRYWDLVALHMPNYEKQKRWLESNRIVLLSNHRPPTP